MSHRAMIDGTAYEVTGGKTLVDGTVYSITGGKTLVDGTVYGIDFGSAEIPVSFDGTHTIYGDGNRGWIEITGNGTLTVNRSIVADIYLLGVGSRGSSGTTPNVNVNWNASGGSGGAGGKYLEVYGQTLSGTYAAALTTTSGKSTSNTHATLGDWTSKSGTSAAKGGSGASGKGPKPTSCSSYSNASQGGTGRQPFTGHGTMSQGKAAKKLGPGGGGGGLNISEHVGVDDNGNNIFQAKTIAHDSIAGADGSGDNTGSGGTGGKGASTKDFYTTGATGSSGIIIVRWGY